MVRGLHRDVMSRRIRDLAEGELTLSWLVGWSERRLRAGDHGVGGAGCGACGLAGRGGPGLVSGGRAGLGGLILRPAVRTGRLVMTVRSGRGR
jgi:hypothetical protein